MDSTKSSALEGLPPVEAGSTSAVVAEGYVPACVTLVVVLLVARVCSSSRKVICRSRIYLVVSRRAAAFLVRARPMWFF